MAGRASDRVRTALLAAVSVVVVVAGVACAPPPPVDLTGTDGPYGVRVTRNLPIHLADGRVLRADVYEPTDPTTGVALEGPFPVIVAMTPYGKSGAASAETPGGSGVNLELVRHGYLAAAVDVPGTGASDGAFDLFDRAEAVAGAEVVRWAAELPRSSGSVGMLGLSYMGIVQLFTAAEVGPGSPLKAIFPMAATVDPYRDLFTSGGALNVLSPLGLLFGYGVTRSVTPFVEEWDDPLSALRHAGEHLDQMSRFEAVMADHMFTNGPRRYDGEWWQARRPERVLERIADNAVAVYLVGGLYDVFQRGEPLLYSGLQNAAARRPVTAPMAPDQPVSDRFRLLTGPWTHGNLGEGIDLSAIQLEWFDHWLKGMPAAATDTPITVIEPDGSSYEAATYPLSNASLRRWWLRSGDRSEGPGDGVLGRVAPSGSEAADRIDYSPFGPVCTASTVQFAAGIGRKDCLVPQQRGHDDNEVVFTSDPLEEPLHLAGPIVASLAATSSTPEALFNVTVEDVAADGSSTALSGGAQLATLRSIDEDRSWFDADGRMLLPYLHSTSEASTPVPIGEPVRYDIEVRPAFATVATGHRLRLRISTADFPHIVPLADMAGLEGGHQMVLHDAANPSYLDVSVRG